ncbi:hypothetical protein TcG_11902, partial [Trypanosoma cruzi]
MSSCSVGDNTGATGSKGQSRLFPPAVPMALGVVLAQLGGRRATQPHCNACQQNSQGPSPPQQRNVQSATTPPHYSPFFILSCSLCVSVCPITDTKNNCTTSQRKKSSGPPAGSCNCPPP